MRRRISKGNDRAMLSMLLRELRGSGGSTGFAPALPDAVLGCGEQYQEGGQDGEQTGHDSLAGRRFSQRRNRP